MSERQFATIEGRVLVPALKLITRVIERRNTYPILGMVLIRVEGTTLTLRGTDLDVELTAAHDVIDAGGEWSVCVDARVLLKIAKLAGSATLNMELQAAEGASPRLALDAGAVSYELDGQGADDHPAFKGKSGPAIETFAPGRLGELIGKVAWCRSFEETRYYLNGVAWQFGPRGRRFAATDGHRLAICRYEDLPAAAEATRIIPNKAVEIFMRLGGTVVMREQLDETTGEVLPLKLEAVAGNITVRCRLIEGTGNVGGYPDVDRVIPGDNARRARFAVQREEMLGAITRALVLEHRGDGRALKLDQKDGRITVGVKRPDLGSATVALSSAWPEEGVTFGVNGHYLRDVIKSCAPGDIALWQVDAGSPLTVLDADTTMTRLVMPMRV